MRAKKQLGELLIQLGFITAEQLGQYTEGEPKTEMELCEALEKDHLITREQMATLAEYQFGVPYVDLRLFQIEREIPKMIPETLARRHCLVAIDVKDDKLVVAMQEPRDMLALDDVRLAVNRDLSVVISRKSDILHTIDMFYDASETVEQAFEEISEQRGEEEEEAVIESEEVARSPVVRLVNTIISRAIKVRASDIHFEPYEKDMRIRFRIDGDLREAMRPPKSSHAAIVTRIKIMGGMDISEKRIPQDGRVETEVDGRPVDMRISVLPTIYGEKVVIRILDRSSILLTRQQIGFTDYNADRFDKIIKAPEGIVLVTGPTGSGKTTTLYAVLRELNRPAINIISAEDPVEYRLDGINQVQINEKAGMTFAAALRSVLRQDPDIVMVGEIRDVETAQIAVRAAITGHIVLSTLHTNDTASTIGRLIDMSIEPFLLSSSLMGIVAQRLVKKICMQCREPVEVTDADMALIGAHERVPVYHGKGCNACGGSGYSGRIAIHEVFVMDKEIRAMVSRGDSTEALKDAAIQRGMKTLKDSCRDLIAQGVTTIEELVRVAYSLDT